MSIFQTMVITLKHSDGTTVAQHLPVQKDTVNLPWNMDVQGMVPTDYYDILTLGWTSPVPGRSDYLVDEATQEKYSMFSTVYRGVNNLQFRVSKYSGVTP